MQSELVRDLADVTEAELTRYQQAIDAQARTLARLTARVQAARRLLADPQLRQYPVGTHVGNTLENLRALLSEDVA